MSSRTCSTKDEFLQKQGLTEQALLERPLDDVPVCPPGELCNGKTREGSLFDGYCRAYAGQETDNEDGRCKHHGGASDGPPEHNQNAQTHGLRADPKHYAKNLAENGDQAEAEWVRDVSAAIEDRIRANTGSVDKLDRVLARRVAIRLHIAANATEFVHDQGMIETIWTEEGRQDVPNRLLEDLRQFDKDVVNDLKKIGVLDDPDTQQADAFSQWVDYIEEGH